MTRAIALAASAVGHTNPNPAVGAVVLDRAGRVVGQGRTAAAGGPHAEVAALTAAGTAASGGTLVVTLEPCRHAGRTPPCTDVVLAAGVARVVVAGADPHPPAAGGAGVLRDAGVDVETGVLAEAAAAVNAGWLHAVRTGRPHVTWKYAATLDGRTAAADGSSRWITGTAARADVHRERARADAVVVGVGTVLADDPELTARAAGATRQPVRVVVDTEGRTPTTARVLDGSAPTLVAVGAGAAPERLAALAATGAQLLELPRADAGGVDLPALLGALFDREALLVLVEGGARLAASLVRDDLVDRVLGYHAPALLGAGAPLLSDVGISSIADAVRLSPTDVTVLDGDVRITATIDAKER